MKQRKMVHRFRHPPSCIDASKWAGVMIHGAITKSLARILAPRNLMGARGMGRCNWGDSFMFMTSQDYNLLTQRVHDEDLATDFNALSVTGVTRRFYVFEWTQVDDPQERNSTMWKQERLDQEERRQLAKQEKRNRK